MFSCNSSDGGWPPVARFTISPEYVSQGVETQVVLDARASCDQLDYPELCDKSENGDGCPDTCPGGISYSWNVSGSNIEVSNKYNSQIRIKVNIQRPLPITLTVTDCDGNSVSKTKWIGISKSK